MMSADIGLNIYILLFNFELKEYYLKYCNIFHFILQNTKTDKFEFPSKVLIEVIVHQNHDYRNLVYSKKVLSFWLRKSWQLLNNVLSKCYLDITNMELNRSDCFISLGFA